MAWLIQLVASFAGPKLAPWLVYGAVVAALVGGILWLRADAYSDGERAREAVWQEAIRKANASATSSAIKAEEEADENEKGEIARVLEEKEKIDEAIEKGEDVFDVMFPTAPEPVSGGVRP